MNSELRARFDELNQAGSSPAGSLEAEQYGEQHFVAVFTLDSGMRYGLTERGSDGVAWAVVDGDKLIEFGEGNENMFVEVLEQQRSVFDEQLEQGAADRDLPVDQTLLSFPAVALVRTMLVRQMPHFCRLSLMWLLPSELRELRAEIAALVDNKLLPTQLRELAGRLVVPE